MKEASRGTAAIACLPSQDDLNSAYFELRARIDGIVSQAEQQARREPIGKIGFVLAKRNKFGAADWVRSGKNAC